MSELTHKAAMELESEFGMCSDEALAARIGRPGEDSWKMLFFLLFGRYRDMCEAIFSKYAGQGLDFDDFMLELHIKLGRNDFAAISGYKGEAKFKTYLSTIARNLLFDIDRRSKPTIDIASVRDLPCEDDFERRQMEQLVQLINEYPDERARFVLFKTIEGFSSKDIGELLGIKPANVDTIRSRAMKKLRSQVEKESRPVMQASMPRMEKMALPKGVEMDMLEAPSAALFEESVEGAPAFDLVPGRYTILPALRRILGY